MTAPLRALSLVDSCVFRWEYVNTVVTFQICAYFLRIGGLGEFSKVMQTLDYVSVSNSPRIWDSWGPTLLVLRWGYVNTKKVFYCLNIAHIWQYHPSPGQLPRKRRAPVWQEVGDSGIHYFASTFKDHFLHIYYAAIDRMTESVFAPHLSEGLRRSTKTYTGLLLEAV